MSANAFVHVSALNDPTCGINKDGTKRKKALEVRKLLKELLKDEKKAERLTSRILGGRTAKEGEWPWIVFIDNAAHQTIVSLLKLSYEIACTFGGNCSRIFLESTRDTYKNVRQPLNLSQIIGTAVKLLIYRMIFYAGSLGSTPQSDCKQVVVVA